jgi:acid phosphatase type 7
MKKNIFLKLAGYVVPLFLITTPVACTHNVGSVKEVMDKTITRFYRTMDAKELQNLDNEKVMALLSDDEKEVLSTRHWMFTVNVPVIVSVIRSNEQKTTPFWLTKRGFVKTDKTMKNEQTTYEVWQKAFGAGPVGLGVNGFENFMLHYFVSVTPQNKNDVLKLTGFFPANQHVGVLDNGAFIYHDWDELVLKEVPESMKGEKLLTTIRGRGEETHLVGAFRSTAYPSSSRPDQIMLTWSSEPSTGIDIQWRTDTTVADGLVKYREKGSTQEFSVKASRYRMEDRVLMNDRYINRFTAELRNLKPGTTYEYQVAPRTDWSGEFTFTTQASDNQFSFTWFGDTHHSPKYGEILKKAENDYPDAAFYSIAGDMISDGLHREQWDDLFEFSKGVISRKPMMSVLGNHDNRSGLGALMYRELFSYPKNGPEGVQKEHTYAFTYKNALFLMIDATAPIDTQSVWIEKQLANSDATWKFAMFHFPPYNWEEPYFNIQKAWVPIFDKYHVDMVMSGHIHYYMRSKPMKEGKVVDSYNDGTAYLISVGIPAHTRQMTDEPYAVVRNTEGHLYQNVKINGNKLSFVSVNIDNKVIDSFSIQKVRGEIAKVK